MYFYGITVIIICKLLEVVQSNTIKLMANFKNHLHTLSKTKKQFFEFHHFWRKHRGRAGHIVLKKRKILGQQKFLADVVAGRSKNRPNDNFDHIVPPS
jgi:hypothetical protein